MKKLFNKFFDSVFVVPNRHPNNVGLKILVNLFFSSNLDYQASGIRL
ncbi:MAG: hypothetical protein PUP93_16670 [Rhizonema sp. NSF051]|nr:hypothetical protein [Rhizonema sp. NSF051]